MKKAEELIYLKVFLKKQKVANTNVAILLPLFGGSLIGLNHRQY
jgi:hypothetical protein